MNKHSNNDLARFLNTNAVPIVRGASNQRATEHQPRDSRAPLSLGGQQWPLASRTGQQLGPLSEREVRGLFAALSKGTREALGREPTVTELILLKDQVNAARSLLASADAALNGRASVYIEAGRPVFHDPAQGSSEVSGAA